MNDNFYSEFNYKTVLISGAHSWLIVAKKKRKMILNRRYDIAFVDLGFLLNNLADVVPGTSASEMIA